MTKKFIEENLLTIQNKLNNQAIMRHKIQESHEDLYIIYSGKEQPICKECGTPHKFLGFSKGYKETCSKKSCPTVTSRRKKTCVEKYGVETSILLPEVREKALSIAASKDCREKVRQTVQERYGVDNISQLDEVKTKKEETSLKNYGVRYMNQSPNHNTLENSIKFKEYIMPSGNIRKVQGYEDKLLDELLKEYSEDEILTDRKDMPKFTYFFEGKERRYFPDAYIPKTNTIYEVKSEYIKKLQNERNKLKFQSVINAGYNFELKVY